MLLLADSAAELESGLRLFGSLERSDADAVVVGAAPGGVRALLREIVRLAPVGGTLWVGSTAASMRD